MIKKNFLTKSLAYLMSIVIIMTMFVMLGSVTGTDRASALSWSYDTKGTPENDDDVVFFKSDVGDAPNGTIIINSLGYFIAVYNHRQEWVGTVFLTNTTNGSSYYPASGGGVSIPVKHIKDKINAEYAGSLTKDNMLNALSSTFYMVLDTLLTVSVKGNPNSCAYTLKSTNVGYRDVVTAYNHLLNDPTATANGPGFWAPLAIQRNRGASSKYTSACFCLAASSGIFSNADRIREIGFVPSFSKSLYEINWNGTSGNGHQGHADDGSNFIQHGHFGFSANTKKSAPSGYFAIPAGKGDGQPIVNNTDLQATNITFTQGDSVDSPAVSEPFREYESYRPVYTFYNNGSACIANFSCTNYATQHTITNNGVSVGANSTYKILGDRFTMTTDLYNTYVNDVATEKKTDYDFNSMWLLFSERCDTVNVPDLNGDNNIYTVRPKFAVATPNGVIGASTYEEYGANYSGYGNSQKENLYTGLTDVAETSAVGNSPNNSKYSVSNGVVRMTSNNTSDAAVTIPGEAYLVQGKTYRFSVTTNGKWKTTGVGSTINGDTVEGFLYPEGGSSFGPTSFCISSADYDIKIMHKLDDGSFIFACRQTGKYKLRLDVNKSPGTITFSDIRIEEYGTTTYLGQFGGTAIDNGIAYDRLEGDKLYVTNKRNEYSYISYYGNPAANRIAPVYLIEGQKYVVNVEAQSHFFMFWESDGPYAGSNTQGGTISVTQPQVETAYPNGVYAKRIGEKTYTFTPKKTGNYYWRFDIPGGTGATYWFKAPEIYNITAQEQLNITGGNLYTGFKDATSLEGGASIKNKVATFTAGSDDACFHDTTGDVSLVAGQKYIFQCETNGTWIISGDELKNSKAFQQTRIYSDTVQAYLILMDSNGTPLYTDDEDNLICIGDTRDSHWVCMTKVAENTYMFTARKTGKYILRLDVNKMGKTYWFKNPQIYNVTNANKAKDANKENIDLTSIKINTASKKLYSGQQVRFHSETQSLSMFNAKYTTELSATGINSAEITPQTINNMLKTKFNPFSGSFTPSFAKWATTLTKDSRPKYTNRSGLGTINVTAVSYENTIMGKYAGRDNEFKNTVMRKYDVYPTDLEAVSVKVYDVDTGKQITTAKDGQKVKVEYIYKNNTQLPVFATVFYTGNANKTFSSPTVNVETGVTEIKNFFSISLTLF